MIHSIALKINLIFKVNIIIFLSTINIIALMAYKQKTFQKTKKSMPNISVNCLSNYILENSKKKKNYTNQKHLHKHIGIHLHATSMRNASVNVSN